MRVGYESLLLCQWATVVQHGFGWRVPMPRLCTPFISCRDSHKRGFCGTAAEQLVWQAVVPFQLPVRRQSDSRKS